MAIRIFLLLIFTLSCGREIKLANGLESSSIVTDGDTQALSQSGTLIRMSASGSFDRIQAGGQIYKVSTYSAYNALEFIASKPLGTTLNVTFKGKVKNGELLLQEIK